MVVKEALTYKPTPGLTKLLRGALGYSLPPTEELEELGEKRLQLELMERLIGKQNKNRFPQINTPGLKTILQEVFPPEFFPQITDEKIAITTAETRNHRYWSTVDEALQVARTIFEASQEPQNSTPKEQPTTNTPPSSLNTTQAAKVLGVSSTAEARQILRTRGIRPEKQQNRRSLYPLEEVKRVRDTRSSLRKRKTPITPDNW